MTATDRIQPITMPKWGMTMTEGKISAWLMNEGDAVSAGAEFVEIETDKIANGVEAEKSGTLRRILVPVGQSAPCGSLIAVMAEPDVTDEEIATFLDGFVQAQSGEEGDAGPSQRMIEAGGMRLNVVTAGAGEGVAIVLLHGFGADAGVWMFNHEALAADLPVHAIDLPSHGSSDVAPGCAGFADMAARIGQVIDQIAPEGAHLVGHSLGGRIALHLAARRPDTTRSLTLIAPAGFGPGINEDFVRQFISADRRRPMKAALQMLVADSDTISSDMIERTLSYKRIDGVGDALCAVADANLTSGGAAEGTEADIAAVTCPTLVIWGREDAILPAENARMAREAARVEIINAAGHMPQMEQSAGVNVLIATHVGGAS